MDRPSDEPRVSARGPLDHGERRTTRPWADTHGSFRHASGFTLIELVLAMALTAVLIGSLYASLAIALRTQQRTEGHWDGQVAGRVALNWVQRDLEAAVPQGGVLAGALTLDDELTAGGESGDRLTWHATVPGATAPEICRVEILLVDDPDIEGALQLVRRVHRHLLATQPAEPMDEVLARHVDRLAVQAWDGSDWVDTWDSGSGGGALPAAVAITLTLRGPEDDVARRFRRVCRIPASSTAGGGR